MVNMWDPTGHVSESIGNVPSWVGERAYHEYMPGGQIEKEYLGVAYE